jgi:hypothetical protein
LIAELPFKRILTTNWDTLLEAALHQARKPYRRVARSEEVIFIEEGKAALD